jgi:hypothetical protein
MKYEDIEKTLLKQDSGDPLVQISFKNRSAIKGLIIKVSDYRELSRKNLWRIVTEKHIDTYQKLHDENLAKIFNGAEFTKLELLKK